MGASLVKPAPEKDADSAEEPRISYLVAGLVRESEPPLKTENSTDRSAAALRALLSWDDMAKTDTTPVIIKGPDDVDKEWIGQMENIVRMARQADVKLGAVRFSSADSISTTPAMAGRNLLSAGASSKKGKEQKPNKKHPTTSGKQQGGGIVGAGGGQGGGGGANCFWVCGSPANGGVKSQPNGVGSLHGGDGGAATTMPPLGAFLPHSNSLFGGTLLHCAALHGAVRLTEWAVSDPSLLPLLTVRDKLGLTPLALAAKALANLLRPLFVPHATAKRRNRSSRVALDKSSSFFGSPSKNDGASKSGGESKGTTPRRLALGSMVSPPRKRTTEKNLTDEDDKKSDKRQPMGPASPATTMESSGGAATTTTTTTNNDGDSARKRSALFDCPVASAVPPASVLEMAGRLLAVVNILRTAMKELKAGGGGGDNGGSGGGGGGHKGGSENNSGTAHQDTRAALTGLALFIADGSPSLLYETSGGISSSNSNSSGGGVLLGDSIESGGGAATPPASSPPSYAPRQRSPRAGDRFYPLSDDSGARGRRPTSSSAASSTSSATSSMTVTDPVASASSSSSSSATNNNGGGVVRVGGSSGRNRSGGTARVGGGRHATNSSETSQTSSSSSSTPSSSPSTTTSSPCSSAASTPSASSAAASSWSASSSWHRSTQRQTQNTSTAAATASNGSAADLAPLLALCKLVLQFEQLIDSQGCLVLRTRFPRSSNHSNEPATALTPNPATSLTSSRNATPPSRTNATATAAAKGSPSSAVASTTALTLTAKSWVTPASGAEAASNLADSRYSALGWALHGATGLKVLVPVSARGVARMLAPLRRHPAVSLRHLDLSRLGMGGPVPHGLGQIPSLTYVDLFENQLTGPIPGADLGALPCLRGLTLASNSLFGAVPASLFKPGNFQKTLWHLSLHTNLLCQPLPATLWSCANLRELWLGHNALCGPLPDAVGGLASLETLMLAGNDLEGKLPEGLSKLKRLKGLFLQENAFTGRLPKGLCELGSSLTSLSLRSNKLEGPLPACVGRLTSLERLHLGGNSLTGVLPPELGNLVSLRHLYLGHNNFSGAVPCEALARPCNATVVSLHGNPLLQQKGKASKAIAHLIRERTVNALRLETNELCRSEQTLRRRVSRANVSIMTIDPAAQYTDDAENWRV